MTEEPKDTKEENKPEPGTGHLKHSFLVGELIYLRSVEEDDADYGAVLAQMADKATSNNSEHAASCAEGLLGRVECVLGTPP